MKAIKFLILLFFIVSLAISGISATDNETYLETQENNLDFNQLSIEEEIVDNNVLNTYEINSNNFNDYFDGNGIKDSSQVKNGDTLNLNGDFTGLTFKINKALNINGINAQLKNSKIIVVAGGSYSNISNINIQNSLVSSYGILLQSATNCIISDCTISVNGVGAFPIILDMQANNNKVISNHLITAKTSEGKYHANIILGDSHNNYIANNIIESGDSNAIYLSVYGSSNFLGGLSNYNHIYNNTISCYLIPTSWNYAIQMMGSYNLAEENTVIGTYRGISGSGTNNSAIGNTLINLTGIEFSTNELVGGDHGIILATNSTVANNIIINSNLVGSGISVGSNSKVYNNDIEVLGDSFGIRAEGNNIEIYNNKVKSQNVGIYQIGGSSSGGYSGLIVRNNTINSASAIGILIKKQSNRIYPNNIKIIDNIVITENEIAIDASQADNNSYIISNNNVGGKKIISPDGLVDPSGDLVFNGTTYTITPTNFKNFFDDNGNIIYALKKGDILIFVGDFYNKLIKINIGLKLTGSNPNFYNSTIKVLSVNGVLIENLNIVNNDHNADNQWGILIKESNKIVIKNNNIDIKDKTAAYSIFILDSGDLNIHNNKLKSSGGNLTYTILMYSSFNANIVNNEIITIGTGEKYSYQKGISIGEGINVNEILKTYGILAIESSGNYIAENNLQISSLLDEAYANSSNSIAGIDFYFDCSDNIIEYNNITINAKDNYIYGMGVIGAETNSGQEKYSKNNTFAYNNVNIEGYSFGTGFIAGYNSINTIIMGNSINVNTKRFAYGITLEDSDKSIIINNSVKTSADINYIIEMYLSDDNLIENNELYGMGKYVYGIAGYRASNNNIINNNVSALGNSNEILNYINYDVIKQGNSGIILLISDNNLIQNNSITTLGNYSVIAINTSKNNVITYNYLKSSDKIGDASVSVIANNEVHDNYAKYFSNIKFNPIVAIYKDTAIFTVTLSDGGDSKVKFYIGNVLIGETKSVNGVAKFTYKLTDAFAVGLHNIYAEISEDDYKSEKVASTLTITKENLIIIFEDISSLPGNTITLKATVYDRFNNPVPGIVVEFYRDGNRYIGRGTTGTYGIATLSWKMPSSLTYGNYSISAKTTGNDDYEGNFKNATLSLGKAKPVYLSGDNITMYYKDGSRYVVTLLDSNKNPFVGRDVTISINGVDYVRQTDSKGQASIALNLDAKEYLVTVKFLGDKDYTALTISNIVKIQSTLVASDLTKYYKNDSQYYITVYDKLGKLLKNTDVEFNINGVMYTRTTDSNGIAKLSINLSPNKYVITAKNLVTEEVHSNNIVVLSTLNGSDLTKMVGGAEKYGVKVLDRQGKAITNTNVRMNINGVMYTRTTDSNGIAYLSINLDPGEYIITVYHPVDGLEQSNLIRVYPTLLGYDLSMSFQDGSYYRVYLYDTNGKELVGKNISMNINGVIYHRTTSSGGLAKLNINLDRGHYIITASYGGYSTSNIIVVK
ncbi:right-handed parallel beta-helix repeat-containing protein [Methanobrevibacter sp. DSM 116169]|uniref:right-handed parallel beta-helix repeat-containing protein n=1 Tax=Methanobrevibacter sp. DSM 116169 TaxID=3242727 RepID=UPI0038FCA3E4